MTTGSGSTSVKNSTTAVTGDCTGGSGTLISDDATLSSGGTGGDGAAGTGSSSRSVWQCNSTCDDDYVRGSRHGR